MAYLKRLSGVFAFLLFLAPCIFAAIYVGPLNTSYEFSLLGRTGNVAAVGVFFGVALIEACLILLIMGNRAEDHLENAAIPDRAPAHHLRNFFLRVSRKRVYLIALLIVGILPVAYWIARPLYAFRIFQPHLPEYLALAETRSPEGDSGPSDAPVDSSGASADDAPEPAQFGNASSEPSEPAPRTAGRYHAPEILQPSNLPVSGKIMTVNINRHAIDPVLLDLSSDFRPANPDEVGAIAALWWWEVQVGHYGSDTDAGAFREHCTVMVWDRKTKSLLAQQSFVGGQPPSTSSYGMRQEGSKPYAEITRFLNTLPHK